MSIFKTILSKIFTSYEASASASQPPLAPPPPATPVGDAARASDLGTSLGSSAGSMLGNASSSPPLPPIPTNQPVATKPTPASPQVDVAAVLNTLAAQHHEPLDWKRSIVDLMKLLDMDSSLATRKELANELHYSGDTGDSATMNDWLHQQVLRKLAENGGHVPADLI